MFRTSNSEIQERPIQELCGARVVHVNIATGGTFYTSVQDDYDGLCNVLDITSPDSPELIAVLPNNKEALLLAFVAISPDGGYSEVLIEASDDPVTHLSYVDWL